MSTVDIVVVRCDGDRQGDDIVSGLLSDVNVAILRGTAAINDATPVFDVTLRTRFRTDVRNGQTVTVIDQFQGETWTGRITAIDHVLERPKVYTDLTVERFINVGCW